MKRTQTGDSLLTSVLYIHWAKKLLTTTLDKLNFLTYFRMLSQAMSKAEIFVLGDDLGVTVIVVVDVISSWGQVVGT